MVDDKAQNVGVHKLQINSRNSASLTGVRDVLSFDAGEVLLETVQGVLMIRGEELHVSRLTLEKGEVDVDGKIDSVAYSDNSATKSAGSRFGRLFK